MDRARRRFAEFGGRLGPIAALFVTLLPVSKAEEVLDRLELAVPRTVRDCGDARRQPLASAAAAVEAWAADLVWQDASGDRPDAGLVVRRLVEAKQQIDACLDRMLRLRGDFAGLPAGEARQASVRAYLVAASELTDLAGRLRYLLRDAIVNAVLGAEGSEKRLCDCVAYLAAHRVSIGASVLAPVLLNPHADSGGEPYPKTVKREVLRLLSTAGSAEVVPQLVEFLRQESEDLEMRLEAVEVICRIGLPQSPRIASDGPPGATTPQELQTILSGMREATRDAAVGQRHAKLAGVLAKWVERGADGDTFRVEGFEIRPGDWLLMRNPSPYNRFTDLSPGLFTHVGVVATETDVQGVRRFVIVDLPERGDRIPATNVDAYLPRTLHYIFLRHETPNVGKRMGEVAASLIGRESLFDLSFRTDRIAPLRGKLDEAATVQTYCAGFLLLCAQETRAPREEFFPIRERVADGHCSANLAKLGLSIGTDFVSPTAAIFSPRLQIVGRREPMYTPDREIKEAIYDHFADCMVTRELQSSPNVLQWLREKLAHTAAEQPWLARAMARAHGVNERMDLESASKAAAVIETLDEIADRNMNEFLAARQALLAEPAEQAAAGGDSQRAAIDKYRIRHRELLRRWQDGQLTPRLLRIALVDFYARQGKAQVDERFFPQQNP